MSMFVCVHVWACLVCDYNSIKTQADKKIICTFKAQTDICAASEIRIIQRYASEYFAALLKLFGCIYICFYIAYGKYNSKRVIQFQKGVATLQAPNSLAAFIFVSVSYGKYNAIPKGCYHTEQYQYFLAAFNWSWTFCWWRIYTWVQCS